MNRQTLLAALLLISSQSDVSLALVAPRGFQSRQCTVHPSSRCYASINGASGVQAESRYATGSDFEPRYDHCVIFSSFQSTEDH